MPAPALTRRRHPDAPESWRVFYGDTQIGVIAARQGIPVAVDQWSWSCGFYPVSHRGVREDGTAPDFATARAAFEEAWLRLLPKVTEGDLVEHRRERAWTARKETMWASGSRLPTQVAEGRSRCFCGAEIDIDRLDQHVYAEHMELQT